MVMETIVSHTVCKSSVLVDDADVLLQVTLLHVAAKDVVCHVIFILVLLCLFTFFNKQSNCFRKRNGMNV